MSASLPSLANLNEPTTRQEAPDPLSLRLDAELLRRPSHPPHGTGKRVIRKIAETYLNFEETQQTVHLLLDWFRDMRQVDGIAAWAWTVLSNLYRAYLQDPPY